MQIRGQNGTKPRAALGFAEWAHSGEQGSLPYPLFPRDSAAGNDAGVK